MSTTKKPDINKARLLALKKVGVLKDVSGRGNLTDSQKARIRSNWKKYHEVVTAPKGSYTTKDISHYETKEKRALAKSGYKIINDKIYIDKQGNDKATVKRVTSAVKKPDGKIKRETYVVVERKKGERKTETEFIGTATEKEMWRDRLLKEYTAGQFSKGDFIGIKIGDNGIFQRRLYQSIDDIFKYAEYDFDPRDPGTDKEMLLNKMHLVKLSVKDYRDLGATEKSKKQKNSERYQRSKKSKQLNVSKPRAKNKLVGKVKHKK
jgi:hypothetical protein